MEKLKNLFIEVVDFDKLNPASLNARYQVYCQQKKWIKQEF